MELKIEYLPPDKLKPYENNTRKHTPDDIEGIKKSIIDTGFNDPIGIWGKDNLIVEGHGRQIAALEMGLKTVPVIRLDHMTDEQRREYAIRHNRSAEMSAWDFSKLEEELAQLQIDGIEMDDLNFVFSDEEEAPIQITEDEAPEPPEVPKTRLGDIYQLGEHRLICGDSTDVDVIDRLMDGVKADMVFTDPPYGYNYQSNMRTKTEKFDVLENDDEILDFFQGIKDIAIGFVYVCTTWKTADKWIELFKRYYDLTNVIIWDKGGGGIGDLYHTFATDYEMILVCNNGQELRGKRYGSVWNFTNTEISKMKKEELLKIILEQKEYYSIWKQKKDNPNEYIHPTQKPVALSAKAIRSSTDFENIVLDCFGGSGSTLIACEQLNRKCYMCELDEHYCDVIIQRWENFTGKKAVLLNG